MLRGQGWPSKIPHTTVPELILPLWLYSILVESITFRSPKGNLCYWRLLLFSRARFSSRTELSLQAGSYLCWTHLPPSPYLCSLPPTNPRVTPRGTCLHRLHLLLLKSPCFYPSEILCNLTGPASVFFSGDSFPHPSNSGLFVIFKHTILSTECQLCQSLIHKLWNTLNIKRRFLLSCNSHFSRKSQRINKIISDSNKVLWRQWYGVCVCVCQRRDAVSYFKYSAQG